MTEVLVTGGAGYIGSTICSALEDAGHRPIIVDSLVNGRREFVRDRPFYEGGIADGDLIGSIFAEHPDLRFTIHCAALTIVPESVSDPYRYYTNNVVGSLELFRHLADNGCQNVVFSSSASLYDAVPGFMVTEESPVRPQSPYARSKLMTELMLEDMAARYRLNGIALRYFNPIGADPEMRSGQAQRDPSQILSLLVETAAGRRPKFQITGTEWPTRDGTGIRDYIHVWDLAQAHVRAVERMGSIFEKGPGFQVINLGTGLGVTVREMVSAFEKVNGAPISKGDAPPRPGDVAGAYTNADKAASLLNWRTELTLEDGIRDALRWDDARSSVLVD